MDNPTFQLMGSSHPFTPLEGPVDQQPLAPLFAEIGHAVMACARLEYVVTALAIHINKQAASSTLHDPDPKVQFSAMIRLLRTWLRKHPAYANFAMPKDDVFYDALIKHADLRNELVHGFLESINPETGQFVVRRIKRAGADTWSATTTTYDAEVARYLGSQSSLATRHFVEIAKLVFEREPTKAAA